MEGVSVVIPTFNRANKIKRSIESVLLQTYKNIEVIIVDDNSTDNTKEIIDEINDDRIRYFKLNQNSGPSNARNIGVSLSKFEIIAFQDSDDYWKPNKLEIQLDKLKSNDEYALVYSSYEYIKNGKHVRVPSDVNLFDDLEKNILATLFKHNVIGTPTILMKRNAFEKLGGFNNNISALEDWELALKVALNYKIGYIKQDLVCAYYSDNSVNYNMLNMAEAFFYIVNKYPETNDYNNMQCIYRYIATLKKDKEINIWKKRLIPKFVADEKSFYNIIFLTRKLEEIKYNEIISNFIDDDNKMISYLQRMEIKKCNNIVIYGVTDVGEKLYRRLNSLGYTSVFITDTNYVWMDNIEIKNISQIPSNIDYVFVTIRKNIDCTFIKNIWKNANVLNAFNIKN